MIRYFFLRIFFLFILVGGLSSLSFQASAKGLTKSRLDSLNSILESNCDDSLKIQAALHKAYILIYSNEQEALKSAKWALKYSQKSNFKTGVIDAYLFLARIQYRSSDVNQMLLYVDSLDQWAPNGLSQAQQTERLNVLGMAFYKLNRFSEALEYWEEAWRIKPYEKSGELLSNLGNIYLSGESFLKAKDFFLSAANFQEKQGQMEFATLNYLRVSYCYPRGDSTGLSFLSVSEQNARKLNFTRLLPLIYLERVYHFSVLNDFHEAVNSLDSLRLYKEDEEIAMSQNIYFEGLNVYRFYLAQYKEKFGNGVIPEIPEGDKNARELYHLALDFFKSDIEQVDDRRIRVVKYAMIAEMEAALGNYKSASNFFKKSFNLKDSISGNHAQFLLADNERSERTRQEEEAKHQSELRLQQKNNRLNQVSGAGALMILVALTLWFRLNYIQKSKSRLKKEMARSEELLLNILPEEIAQELKDKGRAEARGYDQVSILFTDFKDFTQTSEKLSAEDLVKELGACFEAFDQIMDKYNIEKIKTIGDAYMAAGGLPVPSDDAVKNTVLAGIEMQDFMTQRKMENVSKGKPAFDMRVGIHTGPVVAGIVGVKKFQYDVWGDTVNTAARTESSGEIGKVNITETTCRHITSDPDFKIEGRGKVTAKGKGEIEMYFVFRSKP